MLYEIKIKGNVTNVRKDLRVLRDTLDKVINQSYAQVGFWDNVDTKATQYAFEINSELNGLAMVRTECNPST